LGERQERPQGHVKSPQKEGIIVGVVLGSDDHFDDMKMLMSWLLKNYYWTQTSGFEAGMGIIN
jgi:hypothetical protein